MKSEVLETMTTTETVCDMMMIFLECIKKSHCIHN
jgi:hypothetical protein